MRGCGLWCRTDMALNSGSPLTILWLHLPGPLFLPLQNERNNTSQEFCGNKVTAYKILAQFLACPTYSISSLPTTAKLMNWKFIYPSNQKTKQGVAFSLRTVYLSFHRNVEYFIQRNQFQQIPVFFPLDLNKKILSCKELKNKKIKRGNRHHFL